MRLKTPEDIVYAVESFNTTVQDAAWKSISLNENIDINLRFSSKIIEKVSEKRKLRKQLQKSRCPHLKTRLNHAIKELKDLLESEKNNNVQTYLQKLDATVDADYSLWKATKKLKQPKTASPPLRRLDGSWAQSDKEKTITFTEHLAGVFSPHRCEESFEREDDVTELLETLLPSSPEYVIKKFSKTEIMTIINKLNARKAPMTLLRLVYSKSFLRYAIFISHRYIMQY